jgi:hypothetical protein
MVIDTIDPDMVLYFISQDDEFATSLIAKLEESIAELSKSPA